MPRKNAFTLVELLVVIAIISILAAMLLPALHEAIFQARVVRCIAEKGQLGVGSFLFADEHDGRVPRGIDNYDSGNRELAKYAFMHTGSDYTSQSMTLYWDHNADGIKDKRLDPPGILPAFGYAEDASLYYCPGLEYSYGVQNMQFNYRTTYMPTKKILSAGPLWPDLIDGDDSLPTVGTGQCNGIMAGVSHYFYGGGRNHPNAYPEIGYSSDKDAHMKFMTMASRYRNSIYYSPLLYSCVAYSGNTSSDKMLCHEYRGISGVFFDGSARWISYEEMAGYSLDRYGDANDCLANASWDKRMQQLVPRYLTVKK